jgi:LCP family protein required for cell wall assembly
VTPRHTAPARARAVRHARRPRRHPFLRLTALVSLAVLSFVATGAATAYVRLQNNISSADVDHLLGDDRPEVVVTPDPDDPNQGMPVNILVMGTDLRDDATGIANDGTEGERSDTTIVVHISGDRQRVELVSIPRDSLVDIPECLREDGSSSRAQHNAMFNSAFTVGGQSGETSDGAACTQKTVEANTGVRIDHFVVVNMGGFADMVDGLGGVPICLPQEIYSPKANNLHLQAGNQVLTGAVAANYVRARTGQGLGNGSDTDRIRRQQEFLASMAREVLTKNILTDVPELVRFLNAVTRSLTVSSGLSSIPDLTGLAFSLRSIRSGNIVLMTIPFAAAPSDRNRVVWTDDADAVWANIAADRPIVPPAAPPVEPGTTDGGTSGTPPTSETTDPGSTDPGSDPGTTAPATPDPDVPAAPEVDTVTPDDISTVCG